MATTLTDLEKVAVSVEVVDSEGHAATVQNPVWSSDDETVVTVVASDDGMSAVVSSVDDADGGQLGSANVKFSADADLGDGVVAIEASELFEVISSIATGVTIKAGTPEPR